MGVSGLRNILKGYQCGTVYKPIYLEAQGAAAVALYLRAGQTPPPSLDRDLNTEVQILAGRDLQMRVLDTLGPATVYPQAADAGSSGVTALLNRLRA